MMNDAKLMNQILRKSIGVAVSLAVVAIGFYGNYLPLHKSLLFISAQRNLSGARTLADFEKTMSVPLDAPSPIGQEELVRNTADTILSTLSALQPGSQTADLTSRLVQYIDTYYQPIIARGRGMSFEQDLFIMGIINETAFLKTGDSRYLSAAQSYYEEGVHLGPERPQNLYGLFDIYRAEGNVDEVKAVGGQILRQWPSDDRLRTMLSSFLSGANQNGTNQK